MIDGKRQTIPLFAVTEPEAVAEVMEMKRTGTFSKGGTWDAAVERYLASGLSDNTKGSRGPVLKAIGKDLALANPRSLTPRAAARWWRTTQARTDISEGTKAHYLRDLIAFCKWARIHGLISGNPLEAIQLPRLQENLRDIWVTADTVAELLKDARLRGLRDMEWILALGFECGMRRSEISACRPEWFDLRVGVVNIPATDTGGAAGVWKRKGREGRRKPATVPLSGVMLELIQRHRLSSPYIIAPHKTEQGTHRYRFEYRRGFEAFMKRHNLSHVTIHDMRRSFGSNRVSAGVSLAKVANWMGILMKTAEKHYTRFLPRDEEINRGSAKFAPPEPTTAPPPPPQPAPVAEDFAARLSKVETLFAAGIITPDERQAKREEILRDL